MHAAAAYDGADPGVGGRGYTPPHSATPSTAAGPPLGATPPRTGTKPFSAGGYCGGEGAEPRPAAATGTPPGTTTPRNAISYGVGEGASAGLAAVAAPRSAGGYGADDSLVARRAVAPPVAGTGLASSGTVYFEGQAVEVYSQSAGRWCPGNVARIDGDRVKLEYVNEGQWCQKLMLQSSEFLRAAAAAFPRTDAAAARACALSHTPHLQRSLTPSAPLGALARDVADPSSAAQAQSNERGCAGTPRTGAVQGASAAASGVSPRSQAASHSGGVRKDASPRPQPRQWIAAPREGAALVPAAPAPPPPPPSAALAPSSAAPERADSSALGTGLLAHAGLLNANELQFGEVLGSGGYGKVSRGMYRGAEVAIKQLYTDAGMAVSSEQVEEFKKEVLNLSALRHGRLVELIGVAYVAPSLCIVTEFMPNGSLHDLVHNSRTDMTFAQRMSISVQVAEGVEYLHSRSPPFVHRDIKSLNVVMDHDLNAKLCDFGLTQSMDRTHISRKGQEVGSPRYMAPELFTTQGKITEKVDVWALGCLVMEVVTGRIPHEDCNKIQDITTKTLVNRQWPYTDFTGATMQLRVVAELSFEYTPTYRVAASVILQSLKGIRC